MRKFLKNILAFFLLIVVILALSIFYVPDVVSKDSILGALADKHRLLEKAGPGKIIILGGSNVSFGMDSKKIAEALNRPVVNMGVHAGLGLKYILNDAKPYIQQGDIVLLAPEYEHFYTDNFYGEMELVSVLFDIDPAGRQWINGKQWRHLFKYMPTYAAKKIKNYIPALLHPNRHVPVDIYHRESFNDFGDAYMHWALPPQPYQPAPKNKGTEKLNPEAITFLKDFKAALDAKHAYLLLLPPVIDEKSFSNQQNMVDSLQAALKNNGIPFAAAPGKYKFAGNYFFNSYYHLNKSGVDLRTQLVINDLEALTDTTIEQR